MVEVNCMDLALNEIFLGFFIVYRVEGSPDLLLEVTLHLQIVFQDIHFIHGKSEEHWLDQSKDI